MRDAFYGLGPVVLGIFVVTVIRLSRVALTGRPQIAIAVAAALLAAFTPVGTAGILLLAGCTGVALYHSRATGLRAALVVALLIAAYHWASAALVPAGATASHAAARLRARSLGHRIVLLPRRRIYLRRRHHRARLRAGPARQPAPLAHAAGIPRRPCSRTAHPGTRSHARRLRGLQALRPRGRRRRRVLDIPPVVHPGSVRLARPRTASGSSPGSRRP